MSLRHGGFKSEVQRDRYLAAYEQLRKLGPFPDCIHDITTEHGSVRVYQYGPEGGVPVVLVHGFFFTSAMWSAQIHSLKTDFTLYALDLLGQPGASVQTHRMSTLRAATGNIDSVLKTLNLSDVHLVGYSHGGWLAAHTAARVPQRLATLTLVDPADTVVRLPMKFWGFLSLLMARPHSDRARRAAGWWLTSQSAPKGTAEPLIELFLEGFRSFGPPTDTPPLRFGGNRLLRSIGVPVQVLLAGNSIHSSDDAIQRINAVVPKWQHHVWPHASHCLPFEHPDEINRHIRRFIAEHQDTPPTR